MKIDLELLNKISSIYGDAFYILDIDRFKKNYFSLLGSFREYFPNTYIAYSYKTNYIPDLCKFVDSNGGYAEIVSEMEYELAKSIGVKDQNIYFNGPYKSFESIERLLSNGGYLNIDSIYELDYVKKISESYPNRTLNIGIRCNFDVNDGVLSRFGFDVESSILEELINELQKLKNVKIKGLHLHVATRSLSSWGSRLDKMLDFLLEKGHKFDLEYVSLGGGLYGKMHESLIKQFSDYIPSFSEYAYVAAKRFSEFVLNNKLCSNLKLLIEPGSALAGDAMKFVTKVINIKNIRGNDIATVAGSIYNINPTLNKKNPPIKIVHNSKKIKKYNNLNFGGYTCIESDYLYKGYNGHLAVNDYIIFDNVGSYSIVLKPPFILPNFAIIKLCNNSIVEVKRKESFQDIFHTYKEIK